MVSRPPSLISVFQESSRTCLGTIIETVPTLDRFLTELAAIYDTLRPQKIASVFISDLKAAYNSLTTMAAADLESLACHLDTWRKWARQQIRSYGKELPPDDPLSCPISLFRTLDYGRLETAHTATLAWLLDPNNREHGFGDQLLRTFLGHLTAPRQFDAIFIERVEKEVLIDWGDREGRLDILADGEWRSAETGANKWTLVIEAKIDAWEGNDQLSRYDDWLLRHRADREILRVFLTPDGRKATTSDEEWVPLSFPQLVQIFRKVYDNLREAPGFHFLRFYLAGVLQDVCRLPRNFKVTEDCPDPYFLLSYLKTATDSI